jgi:hypothetical protein
MQSKIACTIITKMSKHSKMFQNLNDADFKMIGNMPYEPYIQSPDYEVNQNTTANFVLILSLEEYHDKLVLNEKLCKENDACVFPYLKKNTHTWNYDERIVKPAEYLFLTKIVIPEPPKKRTKSNPLFVDVQNTKNRYNSDTEISSLLCTESFDSLESINNSISLNNNKSTFTPRRPKTFKYNMRAVNNITKPDTKKSHKKTSNTKKSHKKKL